ncbi:MAG: OmpA family protein [Gemmatimonadota bacterium]|nr:MAG: OmpA family protein [Gemmatimonadota bacterium]
MEPIAFAASDSVRYGVLASSLACLALLCEPQLTNPALAQTGSGGQLEVGVLGQYTSYDEGVAVEAKPGAGGRIAFFLTSVFALEANGDYTVTNRGTDTERVTVTRLGADLVAYGQVTSWNAFYVGAGYERQYYRGATYQDEDAANVILGGRISVGSRVAFRIQGRGTFAPFGTIRTVNLSADAGISIFAFGGPPRDADLDTVPDKHDVCPGTPQGVSVDAQGCPVDSDGDGVFDGPDACPGTPPGASVDEQGCPSDDDSDGIFDGVDVCPDTPAGAMVDEAGCPTDADADAVFDGLDRCADTPAGAEVDPSGCPVDSDGDGVFDGIDRCPDTPDAVAVDEFGCPTDSDMDGVFDANDECPGTPPNTEVNARGCPLVSDADGDGVPDSADRCPNTAPGHPVDAVGCPVLFVIAGGAFVTQQGQQEKLILQGVNFQTSRSRLTQESYAILDLVAASLLEHPDVHIEIGGHTDATGTDAINNPLSQARAQAVMAYLARKGVPLERMEAHGYGSRQPIATNRTREGRAQNRRVELRVIEQQN